MAKLLTADLAFDATDHAIQVIGADASDERNGWLDTYLGCTPLPFRSGQQRVRAELRGIGRTRTSHTYVTDHDGQTQRGSFGPAMTEP